LGLNFATGRKQSSDELTRVGYTRSKTLTCQRYKTNEVQDSQERKQQPKLSSLRHLQSSSDPHTHNQRERERERQRERQRKERERERETEKEEVEELRKRTRRKFSHS
jgi:ATP-dependent RNA helicase DDX46/PRP5